MSATGDRLAALQMQGHLAIDAVYADLADQVEDEVLRYGEEDDTLLTAATIGLILLGIGRHLDRAQPRTFRAIISIVTKTVASAQIGEAPLPEVVATQARLPATLPVLRSLQTSRAPVLQQTSALLQRGSSMKLPVAEVAKTVRDYFSPWFAPRRNADGTLTRAGRQGAIQSWPGRAGMASASPRTAMLTETTAAHTRTAFQIAIYGDHLMRYRLSYQHVDFDECSTLADADSGFGRGVYEPRSAPMIPRHPRCRCHYEMVDRPLVRAA